MNNQSLVKRYLTAAIITISLFYAVIGLIFRPVICNDAINGMVSLHNYLHGAAWNTKLSLSSAGDVSVSQLTWWAPGQYQLPYLLSFLCFGNLGTAVVILMFASLVGGCYFYYQVFKLSGLNQTLILAGLLVLILQRFINIFFIQYNASDLMLFFFTPFYIYCYFTLIKRSSQPSVFNIVMLTAVNLIGLFIKNSFMLFELAFNIFILIESSYPSNKFALRNKISFPNLSGKILTLSPFAIAFAADYLFFLRLGSNPSTGNGLSLTFSALLAGIFVPTAEVLFASLSLSGIYGTIYNKLHLSPTVSNLLMLTGILILLVVIYTYRNTIRRRLKTDLIFRLTLTVAVLYVLFWLAFTVKQSAISNEDRLFMPVTVLLFPYLLNLAVNAGKITRCLYFVPVVFSVFYGSCTFYYRIHTYSKNGSVLSQNSQLHGFKVYAEEIPAAKDFDNISAFISSNLNDDYIVIAHPDLAFRLNVNNLFIVTPVAALPAQTKPGVSYTVLVQQPMDAPPSRFKRIYSSGSYFLYKLD